MTSTLCLDGDDPSAPWQNPHIHLERIDTSNDHYIQLSSLDLYSSIE